MSIEDKDRAFPNGKKYPSNPSWIISGGLTKRELYAAYAMIGRAGTPNEIAKEAVKIADRLIKHLEK